MTARLEPDGETATRVVVDTDLKVTGRPAQFGRGVLQDVGVRIIDQFATCLASRMAAGDTEAAVGTEAVENDPARARLEELGEPERRLGLPETGESPAATVEEPAPSAEPAPELDLGAIVLPVLARRYGSAVLAGLVAVLIVWVLRRRTR